MNKEKNITESKLEKEQDNFSPSENVIINSLPDGKEASLWENANLILTENTKNMELLENKNHLDLLDDKENNKDNKSNPETPINNNKLNINSENKNELMITEHNENLEMDSNEKKSINNAIEDISKFMNSNSSSGKNNNNKVTGYTVKSGNKKEKKKSSNKIDSKRLKDLFNDEQNQGNYMHTEGNEADIHELKNKILKNNNFKSKQFKDRKNIFIIYLYYSYFAYFAYF